MTPNSFSCAPDRTNCPATLIVQSESLAHCERTSSCVFSPATLILLARAQRTRVSAAAWALDLASSMLCLPHSMAVSSA